MKNIIAAVFILCAVVGGLNIVNAPGHSKVAIEKGPPIEDDGPGSDDNKGGKKGGKGKFTTTTANIKRS